MQKPVIDIRDVSYTIDGRLILDKIDWQINKGQHWVVLGPNAPAKQHF
jgi:iron complex transport system ATP-binding protein